MINSRVGIAFVVKVEGDYVLLNLVNDHRGYVTSHVGGLCRIGQPGDLIGVDEGAEICILRVLGVTFAEPREVTQHKAESSSPSAASTSD